VPHTYTSPDDPCVGPSTILAAFSLGYSSEVSDWIDDIESRFSLYFLLVGNGGIGKLLLDKDESKLMSDITLIVLDRGYGVWISNWCSCHWDS
jgi:hypothetical protein